MKTRFASTLGFAAAIIVITTIMAILSEIQAQNGLPNENTPSTSVEIPVGVTSDAQSLAVETLAAIAREQMVDLGLQSEPHDVIWNLVRADEWRVTMTSKALTDPEMIVFIYAARGDIVPAFPRTLILPGYEKTPLPTPEALSIALNASTGELIWYGETYINDPIGMTTDEDREFYEYLRDGAFASAIQTSQADIDPAADQFALEYETNVAATLASPESTADLQRLPTQAQ
jgi:hypothetical protein